MNKKGLTFQAVLLIPRMIFIGIVLACVTLLIYAFIQVDINTVDLETKILAHRLTHAEDSFHYTDPYMHSSYSGLVTIEAPRIDKTIVHKEQRAGAELIKISNSGFYNQDAYDEISELQKLLAPRLYPEQQKVKPLVSYLWVGIRQ